IVLRRPVLWLRVFVFFSSRGRHTRLQGDWSSDVCSSDLGPAAAWAADRRSADRNGARWSAAHAAAGPGRRCAPRPSEGAEKEMRSEERRVGKGCREQAAAATYETSRQL